MELSIDEILRRLLLLGLPLVPLGCDPAHPLRGMPDAHMSSVDARGGGGAGGAAGEGLDGIAGTLGAAGSSFAGGGGGFAGTFIVPPCPSPTTFDTTLTITRSQTSNAAAFDMCFTKNDCGSLCSSS